MKLLVLAITMSGCSWIGVNGPPPKPMKYPIHCTDGHAVTVVDSVIGIPLTGLGAALTVTPPGRVGPPGALFGVPMLILGVTYLLSARSGYKRVEACQEAQASMPSSPDVTAPAPAL